MEDVLALVVPDFGVTDEDHDDDDDEESERSAFMAALDQCPLIV